MKITYTAHIFKFCDGYSAEFQDVPEAFFNTDTMDGAKNGAKINLKISLLNRIKGNRQIPEPKVKPDESKGLYAVEVDIPDIPGVNKT